MKVLRVGRCAAALSLAVALLWSGHQATAQEAPRPAVQVEPVRTSNERDAVVFRFDARAINPVPRRLFLAGSFNGWNRSAEEMTGDGTGVFTLSRVLDEGIHHYKFYSPEGESWFPDPASDKELEIADGFGNSAVMVGPDARKLPPPPVGDVNADAILFQPARPTDFNVVLQDRVRFSLRLQAADVTAINVVIAGADGSEPSRFALARMETRLGLERWSGMTGISGSPVRYVFELIDGDKKRYLTAAGVKPDLDWGSAYVSDARLTFPTPRWTKDAVWYQVFVERFRNGEPGNDPGDKGFEHMVPWTADWWKVQPNETPGLENFYKGTGMVWQRRYGGDIQGLRQKLPYLRELGVTALYLNPVFEAHSMHKYDTRDFRHIDDNFGVKGALPDEKSDDPASWVWTEGDKLFLEFVAEARRQGFRVVIDGVFNHVGRDHPYFRDVMERGAASRYASWFDIEGYPEVLPAKEEDFGKPNGLRFKAWDRPSGNLPAFRKDPVTGLARGPYEHIMNITRRWMAPDGDATRGIDGWRLDVANDIPHPFWIEWRKLVKEINPDAYINGEIWSPAQPWLQGDQFDGVMNYQFAMPAQRFFVNRRLATTPSQFANELVRLMGMYPLQALMSSQNLYDSHDTDRLASMFVNPDLPYDGGNRLQEEGVRYSKTKPNAEQWSRMKQAVSMQMLFVGAPMVYYGSEAGMWSPDDPSNRQPMIWQDLEPYADPQVTFNVDIFNHYQRMIALRRALPELRTGYFRVLATYDADGVLVFSRQEAGRTTLVVVNRSASERDVVVPVPEDAGERFIDYANPASADVVPKGDAPDARPTLQLREGVARHRAVGGKLGIKVAPWGTAVLVKAE
jgi:cyclomaltodextrinase / maltogenic alpha-amylase / neopullulanase